MAILILMCHRERPLCDSVLPNARMSRVTGYGRYGKLQIVDTMCSSKLCEVQ
jgi:hypothetical protein